MEEAFKGFPKDAAEYLELGVCRETMTHSCNVMMEQVSSLVMVVSYSNYGTPTPGFGHMRDTLLTETFCTIR